MQWRTHYLLAYKDSRYLKNKKSTGGYVIKVLFLHKVMFTDQLTPRENKSWFLQGIWGHRRQWKEETMPVFKQEPKDLFMFIYFFWYPNVIVYTSKCVSLERRKVLVQMKNYCYSEGDKQNENSSFRLYHPLPSASTVWPSSTLTLPC